MSILRARGPVPFAATILLVFASSCGEPPAPAASPPTEAGSVLRYDANGRPTAPLPAARRRPNLLVILLDTLRGDMVQAQPVPGEAVAMPTLQRLAAEGALATSAIAPASWTLPSITSFLTGLPPSEHSVDDPERSGRLPGEVTTFAEVLANTHGYETAAFVDGPFFARDSNMLQGFQDGAPGFALQGTAAVVGRWAEKRDASKPFFLLLHTMEAHDPYGAANHPWPLRPRNVRADLRTRWGALKEPWDITRAYLQDIHVRELLEQERGRPRLRQLVQCMNDGCEVDPRPDVLEELKASYLEGVRWVDGLVAQTLDTLAARGLLENTLVVISSDHGEAFGEHGMLGHGRRLDRELVHVPLVMRGPAPFHGGKVIEGVVGLIDVLPTFFDWIGALPPDGSTGHSFLRQFDAEKMVIRPPVATEVLATPSTLGSDRALLRRAIVSARWKYVVTYDSTEGTVTESVFDLLADPLEQNDLAAPAGVMPAGLPFDEVFCRAAEAVRERIWHDATTTSERGLTIYGPNIGRLSGARPEPLPCSSDRR
ncbi:MAG: sulfatase [Planctomycetota bacterium]|nr:sulfatase [Planctomycetota bacterium]